MAKKAKARKRIYEPTYLKGRSPLKIALHDVVAALKEIERKKFTNKFVKAAKKNDAFVRVDPGTVNFVKDFFADNRLHGKIGMHIINAKGARRVKATASISGVRAARDPYDCDFGRR